MSGFGGLPGVGLSEEGCRWRSCESSDLLPVGWEVAGALQPHGRWRPLILCLVPCFQAETQLCCSVPWFHVSVGLQMAALPSRECGEAIYLLAWARGSFSPLNPGRGDQAGLCLSVLAFLGPC